MGFPVKIATCCFCGTKAALTLDQGRHELVCQSCGAPIRDLKTMPTQRGKQQARKKKRKAVDHRPELRDFPRTVALAPKRHEKPRRGKKRGRWFKKFAEEVFDLVEDILD
ncbi:MAG: hypothetical protein AAF943_13230 [Pseudomonadota bacterium]